MTALSSKPEPSVESAVPELPRENVWTGGSTLVTLVEPYAEAGRMLFGHGRATSPSCRVAIMEGRITEHRLSQRQRNEAYKCYGTR